jgi:hypothetical protein
VSRKFFQHQKGKEGAFLELIKSSSRDQIVTAIHHFEILLIFFPAMAVRLDGLDEPELPERDDARDPERRRADGRGLRRHALVHR